MEQDSLLLTTISFVRSIKQYIDSNFNGFDLSYDEGHLILEVSKYEPVSQKDLAGYLNITPATLSIRLKRLEKIGYIERTTDLVDTRKTNVCLTKIGIQRMNEAKEIFKTVNKEWNTFLNEEEKQNFIHCIELIQQHMKGEEND